MEPYFIMDVYIYIYIHMYIYIYIYVHIHNWLYASGRNKIPIQLHLLYYYVITKETSNRCEVQCSSAVKLAPMSFPCILLQLMVFGLG